MYVKSVVHLTFNASSLVFMVLHVEPKLTLANLGRQLRAAEFAAVAMTVVRNTLF